MCSVVGAMSLKSNPRGLVNFCVNVTLYVKPERREQFIKALSDNANYTRSTEMAIRSYTWGESCSQPNTFHIQEQYLNEEGYKFHTKSPHFLAWEQFTKTDPFTMPPEIAFFKESTK
eukprot:gene1183-2302_t